MKKLTLAAAAFSLFLMSGCMVPAGGEEAANPTSGILMYVVVMLVFFGAMYFIAIRPQRKQEKQWRILIKSLQIFLVMILHCKVYFQVLLQRMQV